MAPIKAIVRLALEARFEKAKTWRAVENHLGQRTFYALWTLVATLYAIFSVHLLILGYCHHYIMSDYYSYERRTLGVPVDLNTSKFACILLGGAYFWSLLGTIFNRRLHRPQYVSEKGHCLHGNEVQQALSLASQSVEVYNITAISASNTINISKCSFGTTNFYGSLE
ncbi:hypothetical protein THRCLA_10757 [Thraustotheca clavata]|uniref:Uncharacterized protein n=1 Tax=Thraustotheca clavata TaxID=74557 RepID=A0A1V9YHH4_9STRA|nr:hypothetical protein THRCLA_10757 [Thraustotheca clavata]